MNDLTVTFIPNVWIKCIYNYSICLGRTYIQSGIKNSLIDLQMVCLVSDTGHAKHVLFSEVTNASVLRITTVCDFDIAYDNIENIESNEIVGNLAALQLISSMS